MAQAKRKKKKISPVSIIVVILCSCVALYFIYSIVDKYMEISEKKAELTEVQNDLESQKAENEALESAVSSGNEKDIAEEQAREKGYVMPDERVYVDITPGEE